MADACMYVCMYTYIHVHVPIPLFSQSMFLLASMGPPGGGRMVISKRLQSRFNLINMTFPQVHTLYTHCMHI